MLLIAVAALGLTVLLGAALAIVGMRAPLAKPSRVLTALHGACATIGIVALLLALRGPARGAATGTQSFGLVAAILLLLAALIGIVGIVLHARRARFPGGVVGAHASIAIAGYVVLAVYLLAG
jgi:hypothetical protein